MKRMVFLGALMSVLCAGCVDAQAQPEPVVPQSTKVPAVPIAFDQGPEWDRYWEVVLSSAHGLFHGNRFGHVSTFAHSCADVMVFEAMGIRRSDWAEPLGCLIPGIQARMFEVPALLKRAGVDLGWMLWVFLPYDPEFAGGRCSEPDCGAEWRTMWVSSGPVGTTPSAGPMVVELSPNGWSTRDEFTAQWRELRLIGDINADGSAECILVFGEDALQGTYYYMGTQIFEFGQGYWTREEVTAWTEAELRRASAELLRDPMIRGYALKRALRHKPGLVEEIVGWDDGKGVF